jgi:hypothetical protein
MAARPWESRWVILSEDVLVVVERSGLGVDEPFAARVSSDEFI